VGSEAGHMSYIRGARTSRGDIKASGIQLTALSASATGRRCVIQLFAIVLGAASLAGCARSSVVTNNSGFVAASRQAALEHNQSASVVTKRRVAVTNKHTPFASNKNVAETPVASHGIASFYTEGTQTASGEKFDTHELTAAHPTLPFGTRLHVTNVTTGRSVTVRVNDRGPFVSGRAVDVSYAAAERLGMVGAGIAKVKLDVVQ
jgi:rare lipoprotein A